MSSFFFLFFYLKQKQKCRSSSLFNLETFFNLVYYLVFFNRFNIGVLFSNLLLTKKQKNVGVLLVDYLNQ